MSRAVLLATVAALLGACGVVHTPPTLASPSVTATPRRADRLVALVGPAGAMRLVLADPAGLLQPLAGPGLPADAAWLSGGGQILLATTLSGRALVGSAAPGGSGHGSVELMWQPALAGLGDAHQGRSFGVTDAWSQPLRLRRRRPRFGWARSPRRRKRGRPRDPPVRAAAAGRGSSRLAARRPNRARHSRRGGPAGGTHRRSSDGATDPVRSGALQWVAIAAETAATIGHDGTVRIGTVSGWLAGASGDRLPGLAPDDVIIQTRPSAAGDEVALVLANSAGDASSIRILGAEGGWHEVARFELPRGANRAVVGWLVAP